MRSNRVVDEADWLEPMTDNAKVATVLDSVPSSLDTVESGGRQINIVDV